MRTLRTFKTAFGIFLCRLGISDRFIRMLLEFDMKKDVRSYQKKLEDLLDVQGGSYGVNLVDFDEIAEVWLVSFSDKENMRKWSHLNNWFGFPVVKIVGEINPYDLDVNDEEEYE